MTATQIKTTPGLTTRLIDGVLAIKPLANLAKHQARNMMIKRAEKIGVPWRENVKKLRSQDWESDNKSVTPNCLKLICNQRIFMENGIMGLFLILNR